MVPEFLFSIGTEQITGPLALQAQSGRKIFDMENLGLLDSNKDKTNTCIKTHKHMQLMDFQDLSDTKSLSTFSIKLNPSFALHLSQQNNTQNHGTTVWDSAKLLAFYLFDTIKKPTFKENKVQNNKTCLELGSGCGLGGLIMASLGFETVLTDLPEVVDRVLQPNCATAIDAITDWWYHLQHTTQSIDPPKITVQSLDWLQLMDQENQQHSPQTYHYIIASDCIYEIELVEPLLNCIRYYASPSTMIFIAMERRDDTVVDGFINKAKAFGFEARMILKKLLNSKSVGNEDVEIWKLKLRKSRISNNVMLNDKSVNSKHHVCV